MQTTSLYDLSLSQNNNILYTGYNYTVNGNLLKNTLSPYLFENTTMNTFLTSISDALAQNIEVVKKIRVFINYTVPKDYKNIL